MNYDILRAKLEKTIQRSGLDLTNKPEVLDNLLIIIEDLMWDGSYRWATHAKKLKWLRKSDWKDDEELATSIVTHILTYWNQDL